MCHGPSCSTIAVNSLRIVVCYRFQIGARAELIVVVPVRQRFSALSAKDYSFGGEGSGGQPEKDSSHGHGCDGGGPEIGDN